MILAILKAIRLNAPETELINLFTELLQWNIKQCKLLAHRPMSVLQAWPARMTYERRD